jgi:hypothetical protein
MQNLVMAATGNLSLLWWVVFAPPGETVPGRLRQRMVGQHQRGLDHTAGLIPTIQIDSRFSGPRVTRSLTE